MFFRTYVCKQFDDSIYFLVGSKFTEIIFGDYEESRVDKEIESADEFRDLLKYKFGLIVDNDLCKPVNNYPE